MFDPRHSNSGKQLRCDALTGNVDFAPTILKLAGLPTPDNMDGKDLMQLYQDPQSKIHESLPLINVWGPKQAHNYAVNRNMEVHLLAYQDEQMSPTKELDTGNDPSELTDLSGIASAAVTDSYATDYGKAVPWQGCCALSQLP